MSMTRPAETAPVVGAFPPHVMAANLEIALRRAAFWARRGMPHTAAELLAGTDGALRFRPEHGDLAARLPGGEQVRLQLSSARRRVTISRTGGRCELVGSADLPPHLVERSE